MAVPQYRQTLISFINRSWESKKSKLDQLLAISIPSILMAIPHFTNSLKSLLGNHSMLKRSKRESFFVHEMNGFIKTSSSKPKIPKLTKEQSQLIRQKIKTYNTAKYRSIYKISVFTLVIASGLLFLLDELWRRIN